MSGGCGGTRLRAFFARKQYTKQVKPVQVGIAQWSSPIGSIRGFHPFTTHAHEAPRIPHKQVPSCLSDAAQHARFGELAGLQPYKTAPFVGCVGFSTRLKNQHTPLQSGLRHAASEQAVAYLRKIRKLSGLPLCKAGDWGLQTPETILFVLFFCGYAAKKENKRGPGAAASIGFTTREARGNGVPSPR